jgi:hypothetical protein
MQRGVELVRAIESLSLSLIDPLGEPTRKVKSFVDGVLVSEAVASHGPTPDASETPFAGGRVAVRKSLTICGRNSRVTHALSSPSRTGLS